MNARSMVTEPPGWVVRATRWATGIELGIGAVATVLIFLLVIAQAAQRYLPFDGWSWTGELARYCLVVLTFVVAGVLVTSDSHISIELVDSVRNPIVVRVVRVIALLIVALIGVALAAEAWSLTFDQPPIKSPAMRMPMSWLYALTLVGFVSTVIRALLAALTIAVVGVPERHQPEEVAGR